MMSRQILNGWKEISNHIERSVRTVQRWEARLGLPVYRPALKDRSAVVAFSDEVDRWVCRSSPGARNEDAARLGNEENEECRLQWLEDMRTLVSDTSEPAAQIRCLQKELGEALEHYRRTMTSRRQAMAVSRPSRGAGSVLQFRPRSHRVGGTFAGDVRGRADHNGIEA
jgi:hypothetical protein